MLHDRRQRHRKRLRQFADRERVAAGKPRQQRAPGRIGKRGKGAVEGLFLILNHMVYYSRMPAAVKQASAKKRSGTAAAGRSHENATAHQRSIAFRTIVLVAWKAVRFTPQR